MKKWFKTNMLWLTLLLLVFIIGFILGKNQSTVYSGQAMVLPPAAALSYEPPTPIPTPVSVEVEEPVEVVWETYIATAYCPCEKCCGKYAKNRPNGIVYTASGEIAEEGVTIAADWEVLPPGTEVEIEGIGVRTVQDKGSVIKGNRIDLFFESHQRALEFGVQEVHLRILDKK